MADSADTHTGVNGVPASGAGADISGAGLPGADLAGAGAAPPGAGAGPPPSGTPLLEVSGLDVRLGGARAVSRRLGGAPILSGVDLSIGEGEIVGVIGETGSGKTTLARAILGLVRPSAGTVRLAGEVVSGRSDRAMQALWRKGSMQFVFQDPLRSLDPDMTVRQLVTEGLDVQGELDDDEQWEAGIEALRAVGLDPAIGPRRPGQLSGGQRQRVAIARAVVMRPKLLICDEPVSALDASTRNQVLGILASLRETTRVALLVISHDLSSLAGVVDRIAVLYRGRIVESGPVERLFSAPSHPYTALLVASSPSLRAGGDATVVPPERFVSSELRRTSADGCAFAARCAFATDVCTQTRPTPEEVAPGWKVACHRALEWRATLDLATSGRP